MLKSILYLVDNILENSPFLFSILFAILLVSLTLTIFNFLKMNFFKISRLRPDGIHLIKGSRQANKPYRIASNPNDINYINIPKSYNEKSGIEFTYNLWFIINKPDNHWQHVFHKGNSNAYPLRAPGVWIKENNMKICMNSTTEIDKDTQEISGLPMNKWCMLTIILRGNILNVYLNGYLVSSREFKEDDGVPKLNDEPIYITQWYGFNGYISDFDYFNYALTTTDIKDLFDNNPTTDGSSIGFDVSDYLSHGK